MIVWILAVLLLGILGLVGYYQGALRVAISTLGLLVASLLAVPLAGVFRFLLPVFGVSHPALVALLAPFLMFVVIMIIFKATAMAVNRKVEWWYKNKDSETKRLLWERMNSRLGICMGLVNGSIYLILICVAGYVVGYLSVQVGGSKKDSFAVSTANSFAADLQSTGVDKAVAGFVPASNFYFDAVDVVGLIFHNPLLQSRLATYPPFLGLSERPEFKDFAKDAKFQEFWQSSPSLGDFMANEKVSKLLDNVDMYTNVVGLVQGDLKDLKAYLETGNSPKYEDQKILGRWKINYGGSMSAARKKKPYWSRAELQVLATRFSVFKDAEITAMIDNTITLKLTPPLSSPKVIKGTWSGSGSSYVCKVNDGGNNQELPVTADDAKLVVKKDGFELTFEKE
jgi:hypothetical protein